MLPQAFGPRSPMTSPHVPTFAQQFVSLLCYYKWTVENDQRVIVKIWIDKQSSIKIPINDKMTEKKKPDTWLLNS
jgi:hypothetical protein